MQLPGFTSEVSLHTGSTSYRATPPSATRTDLSVLAQLRGIGDPVGTCYSWCFLNGGSPLQCFFACGPGQLGGGWGVFNAGAIL